MNHLIQNKIGDLCFARPLSSCDLHLPLKGALYRELLFVFGFLCRDARCLPHMKTNSAGFPQRQVSSTLQPIKVKERKNQHLSFKGLCSFFPCFHKEEEDRLRSAAEERADELPTTYLVMRARKKRI